MGKYVKKDLKNLISKLKEDSNSKGSSSDENTKYWRPELAKEDESSEYVVRFLPSVNSDLRSSPRREFMLSTTFIL